MRRKPPSLLPLPFERANEPPRLPTAAKLNDGETQKAFIDCRHTEQWQDLESAHPPLLQSPSEELEGYAKLMTN